MQELLSGVSWSQTEIHIRFLFRCRNSRSLWHVNFSIILSKTVNKDITTDIKRMTDGVKLTTNPASRSTPSLKGEYGHAVTLGRLHSNVWEGSNNIQSLWAYDGWSYAYGQRTMLREPTPVTGQLISPVWWCFDVFSLHISSSGKNQYQSFKNCGNTTFYVRYEIWNRA